MRKLLVPLIAVTYLAASCASYNAQSVSLPSPQAMGAFGEDQGLFVEATPYVDPEKTQQMFDTDLRQAGILAVQVLVNNTAPGKIPVRKSGFVLRLPEGKEQLPSSVSSVATRLESSAGVIGWTIAFGLIGYLASSSQQDRANTARRDDFRNKEFQDTTLLPQESAHGFLYFLIPEDSPKLNGAALVFRGVDAESSTRITVSVPLPNLGE